MNATPPDTEKTRLRNSVDRQDRLGGAALVHNEQAQQREAQDDQHDHLRSAPAVGRAAETREQDDCRQSPRQQRRAEVVDLGFARGFARRQHRGDHGQRHQPDGQVDVEDPPPRDRIDEEAAEQRSDHGGDAEHGPEIALIAPPLARRDDVADDGERHDHEAAAAEPLERAERDQLGHALGEPAQRRADQEDDERCLQQPLAAEEVAELAVQRPHHCRCEQIRGDDPRELRDASEVADDRRQRGRDDRLVE